MENDRAPVRFAQLREGVWVAAATRADVESARGIRRREGTIYQACISEQAFSM